MTDVHITGYHTSSNRGGSKHLMHKAPFLSKATNNQWLTQGYYFWTDDIHFAHKWGTIGYKDNYAILKCSLEIDSDLLLDLVGSVSSQILFDNLQLAYQAKLEESSPGKKATVEQAISFWRNEAKQNKELFPFIAIKAQDNHSQRSISFTGGIEEMFIGARRQQLCLFKNGISCLKKKELVHLC